MSFLISKISNHGVSNPIVARLAVQTSELIQWANLPKDKKDAVTELYMMTLQHRLLKCYEIQVRLNEALHRCSEEASVQLQNSDNRLFSIPHVIGLDGEVESLLYEAKNFLRDLINVLRIFFGYEKIVASQFYDKKGRGDSELANWAKNTFGEDDDLTKLLRSEQQWVEQVIRMRDAVEHPGGYSGTLTIRNVRVQDGEFIPPRWSRAGGPETDIFRDAVTIVGNMLTVAEDLLVICIKKKSAFPNVCFYEIPQQDRNKDIPQRFKVGLSPELAVKLRQVDDKSVNLKR